MAAFATLPGVTVPAGARLFVWFAVTGDAGVDSGSVTWNGLVPQTFEPLAIQPDDCNTFSLSTWHSVSGGTGNIVGSTSLGQAVSLTASYWTNMAAQANDTQANTTAGSSATPTLITDNAATLGDVVVAAVMQAPLTTATRTWGNGLSDGQLVTASYVSDCGGDGHKLSEGFKIATSAGPQTASKSGGAASIWGMIAGFFHTA